MQPAAGRGNLTIMTGCQVKRLKIISNESAKRCTGVEFVGGGKEWFAESIDATILSAGAIGSPTAQVMEWGYRFTNHRG